MASLARQLKRKSLVVIVNKLTGKKEVFRRGKRSLVYTGISYNEPKSEIPL